MLILFAFCGQRAPKGSQTEPKWHQNSQNGPQRAPKRSQMSTRGGPRSPKRRVKGGVRESGRKKDGPPGEPPKQMGAKLHNCWSHVAYFGVIFSMFFQGRFWIDFLTVLGLFFNGFLVVFSIIFGPFSRTPEPLIFDNSPMP